MVPWRDVNIEAPIARAFMDRGLSTASHIITLGALAGLDQRDAGDVAGADARAVLRWPMTGCCRRNFSPTFTRNSARPGRTRSLVGLLAAIVGSVTPIDDIGKMVNIGTLLAFVIVCIAVMVLRTHQSRPGAAVPHAVGAGGAGSGDYF